MNTREVFYNSIASKFGPLADVWLQHYDDLVLRFRGDELKALDVMLDAAKECNRRVKIATASTANMTAHLSPAGKAIRNALIDMNANPLVSTKEALERIRELQLKMSGGLEYEMLGKMRLGLFQTEEHYNPQGMIERKRVYKEAVASTEDNGLALEVRI